MLGLSGDAEETAEVVMGCRALVTAVLKQALDDLKARSTAQEVRRWVLSESGGPFSYVWCCDVLGLEPDGLRARVRAGETVGTAALVMPTRKTIVHATARKPRQSAYHGRVGGAIRTALSDGVWRKAPEVVEMTGMPAKSVTGMLTLLFQAGVLVRRGESGHYQYRLREAG